MIPGPASLAPTGDRFPSERVIGFDSELVIDFVGMRRRRRPLPPVGWRWWSATARTPTSGGCRTRRTTRPTRRRRCGRLGFEVTTAQDAEPHVAEQGVAGLHPGERGGGTDVRFKTVALDDVLAAT